MCVPADLRAALEKRLAPTELSAVKVIEPASIYADFDPQRVADR